MAYKTWVIGGLTPSWVEPDFKDNRDTNTLTLKCAAMYDVTGTDPIDEIESFDALASEKISNDSLLNGGTKLQVRGQVITVTATNEGSSETKTWTRCAIKKVEITLDSFYNEDNPGSIIEYELIISYQTQGGPGGSVYYPSYDDYDNTTYYMWTTMDNTGAAPGIVGSEIGYLQITEPQNVIRVEVYGSACCSPSATPAYLEVNGVKQYWHYTHDMMASGDSLPSGYEKLTFELATPATVVTLETGDHIYPSDTCSTNMGCWLQWVRVVYE